MQVLYQVKENKNKFKLICIPASVGVYYTDQIVFGPT